MAQEMVIGNFGYPVITVHKGVHAVDAVQNDPGIDLVLMDIDLGKGIDGTEAARQILEIRNMPIVFLTSHSEREMVERVKGITRYGYIIKNSGDFVLKTSIEMAYELFEAYRLKSESEAHLRTLIQTLPDMVWLKNENGQYLSCNNMFERFFGATEDEIRGKTDYDFVENDLADSFRKNDRLAIEGGKPRINEEWVVMSDSGRDVLLETTKTPMYEKDGRLLGVLGIGHDITERNRMEEAVQDSEIKYRSLVEKSLVGVFIIQNGRYKFVNGKFCEIFGYSEHELFEEEVSDIMLLSEEKQKLKNYLEKITNGESPEPEDFRAIKKDRQVIHIRMLANSMQYEGNPSIMGTVFDITDQVKTMEALEKRIVAFSKPLDDPEGIDFKELFNIDDIQRLQDEFSEATGVAALITYPDGTPITKPSKFSRLCGDLIRTTEKGLAACRLSDTVIGRRNSSGPILQPCLSCGLWDAGASIIVDGKHIATWLIGQVRDPELTIDKVIDYADVIGIDRENFISAFNEIPVMEEKSFRNLAQVLFSMATELSVRAYQNILQSRFIREIKEGEEALKRSEYRFRVALQNIPTVVSIYGKDLRYKFVNNAAKDVTGLSPAEITGKQDRELWPQIYHNWENELVTTFKEGTNQQVVFSFDYASGLRTLKVIFLPLRDGEGNVSEVMGITVDISKD